MKHPRRLPGALALISTLASSWPTAALAESSLGTSLAISADDQGYRWDRYELALRHDEPEHGQWLAARFHSYSLGEELGGVLPFAGSEPAAEIGGHLLEGWWWMSAAAGFQGKAVARGATGRLVLARAIPVGSSTLTPRLEAAREPLALTALPLSLGLSKYRFDAALAWRAAAWKVEAGGRFELWEPENSAGRTRNPALDVIAPNRSALLHAHALHELARWADVGLAARVAWATRSTMLLTELTPTPTYTWYPASAPPFEWATALVLAARGPVGGAFELGVQLQLPLLSQESRDWEGVRRDYWGCAAFEGRVDARWMVLASTTLQLDVATFAKPWSDWDPLSDEAYRQGLLRLSIQQRL